MAEDSIKQINQELTFTNKKKNTNKNLKELENIKSNDNNRTLS